MGPASQAVDSRTLSSEAYAFSAYETALAKAPPAPAARSIASGRLFASRARLVGSSISPTGGRDGSGPLPGPSASVAFFCERLSFIRSINPTQHASRNILHFLLPPRPA